jgi:cyclopropane fatty-acyl-phospholipid synthase-like methyltransferase
VQVVTTFTNGKLFECCQQFISNIPGRFLGPRMIYTSGIVLDLSREETLEELQDNKLSVVCSKLRLQPTDRLLDIGCGWGTLAAYAAKNFDCDVTGVTLAKNQTAFANDRIRANGVTADKARILCMDYRDLPGGPGYYTKIVSLEMAEVGVVFSVSGPVADVHYIARRYPSLRYLPSSSL